MKLTKLVLLSAVCVVVACGHGPERSNNAQTQRIAQLIHAHRSDTNLDSLRAMMVITEQGCIPCSREFSTLMTKHLDDPKVLFWVSAKGTEIDLSDLKDHPDRVVWDYDHDLQRSGLLDGSGAILFKNDQVDTIIPLDARYLGPTLAYIRGFLNAPQDTTLSN